MSFWAYPVVGWVVKFAVPNVVIGISVSIGVSVEPRMHPARVVRYEVDYHLNALKIRKGNKSVIHNIQSAL